MEYVKSKKLFDILNRNYSLGKLESEHQLWLHPSLVLGNQLRAYYPFVELLGCLAEKT
jgi:hypothetical protein